MSREPRSATPATETVLILTPLKDAAHHLATHIQLLSSLTYPHRKISLGFLEGDSRDDTARRLSAELGQLRREFAAADLWQRNFGYMLPEGMHRSDPRIQP